ncbi:purine and uridine phosphorylase [Astrocystis sublimbata]|nr:purine and uridine phosphorylase [Astrocystis sublimbata]KAI0192508.1 purine and uridine phosphorylase [Astrocystis sublimbata]
MQQFSHEDYTVGWICTLSLEHIAAVAFLDEKHHALADQDPADHNSYTLGRYGRHNTVIAVVPPGDCGVASAACVARDMMRSFPNIRFGLMVGIGGGAPSRDNDIRLGDVVVSIPGKGRGGVVQFDMGKNVQDEDFQLSGYLDQPPTLLRTNVQSLRTSYTIRGHRLDEKMKAVLHDNPNLLEQYSRPSGDSDRLYQSDVLHKNNLCCCAAASGDDASMLIERPLRRAGQSLFVHYGLIASGDSVIRNSIFRDNLAKKENVLCFAAGAAGVMNNMPCLVVCGISNYSDTHEDKRWQGYAAMAATAYAKDLLAKIPAQEQWGCSDLD